MTPLSDKQLEATLVLQEAEIVMEQIIEQLTEDYADTPYMKQRLEKRLEFFKDLCIKYGRLQSTHEKLLKDVTKS